MRLLVDNSHGFSRGILSIFLNNLRTRPAVHAAKLQTVANFTDREYP